MLLGQRRLDIVAWVLICFCVNQWAPLAPKVYAQTLSSLPAPGTRVNLSSSFTPPIIRGITLYPDDPFRFDFIVDTGDDQLDGQAFEEESNKLIKYFLAALTVPEEEMWVNLSPYEKDRIIADGLKQTEMGRDLLAQDYMLKQLTASLMFPDEELGKDFWKRVYKRAQEEYGTTDIPMNTFNKIWIVPESADVYVRGSSVFVAKSHLKVLLEEDYLALESNQNSSKHGLGDMKPDDLEIVSGISSAVVREVLIPEIEREVNEGKNFANLRQVYHSMILATWYKKNLKKSLLGRVYVDQNKAKGIELEDQTVHQKIYNQYVEAFKKGVFDLIKEDYDPISKEVIPRKYFSGGFAGGAIGPVSGEVGSDGEAEVEEGLSRRVLKRVLVKLEGWFQDAFPVSDFSELSTPSQGGLNNQRITAGNTDVNIRSAIMNYPIEAYVNKNSDRLPITIVDVGSANGQITLNTAEKFGANANLIGVDLNVPNYVIEFTGDYQFRGTSMVPVKYHAFFEIRQDDSGQVEHHLTFIGKIYHRDKNSKAIYYVENPDFTIDQFEEEAIKTRDKLLTRIIGSNFKDVTNVEEYSDYLDDEDGVMFEPVRRLEQGVSNLKFVKSGFELSTIEEPVDIIRVGNVFWYYDKAQVHAAIDEMGTKLKEGGELIIVNNSSYLIYKKVNGQLTPLSLSISLSNEADLDFHEEQFPEFQHVFQDAKIIVDKERSDEYRAYKKGNLDVEEEDLPLDETINKIVAGINRLGYEVTLDDSKHIHIPLDTFEEGPESGPGNLPESTQTAPGGIDLNADNLDIQARGDDFRYETPYDVEEVPNVDIQGFRPIVIDIIPTNVRLLFAR